MSEAVLLGCNVPHNPDRHIEALYNCMCLGLIALYENIYIGRPGSKGLRSITKEYGRGPMVIRAHTLGISSTTTFATMRDQLRV